MWFVIEIYVYLMLATVHKTVPTSKQFWINMLSASRWLHLRTAHVFGACLFEAYGFSAD